MKKILWTLLDNLPTIFVILAFAFGMVLAAKHAGVM